MKQFGYSRQAPTVRQPDNLYRKPFAKQVYTGSRQLLLNR